jgi:hypothetical protein
MFSLVSSRFLAMRNITLHSVRMIMSAIVYEVSKVLLHISGIPFLYRVSHLKVYFLKPLLGSVIIIFLKGES